MPSLIERLREALAPRYEVDAEIATGGMAIVFRALDTSLGRVVAVKVLRPDLATATAEERFRREARTLASFSHPNMVAIHDVGEVDGLSYYVMDYVDGETLTERLARGPLDGRDSFRLGRDLLDALARIHEAGVVHRDVKPSNIFLVDERALVADFGVAHLERAGEDSLTHADGPSPGTPAYMAPEQRAGEPVSPATDLYAVAMVLYEALTGRRWPIGLSPEAGDWRDVPLAARRPLRRALALDPSDRWPDAGSFRAPFGRLHCSLWLPAAEPHGAADCSRRLRCSTNDARRRCWEPRPRSNGGTCTKPWTSWSGIAGWSRSRGDTRSWPVS
jgi:serine/threonine-protein kinase